MFRVRRVGVLCGVLLCGLGAGVGQTAGAPASASAPAGEHRVSDRQKQIDADTEKLVQMAAELKVSVDKSTKNELSLEVVRKAEAVEKLAKSLKERIRDAR